MPTDSCIYKNVSPGPFIQPTKGDMLTVEFVNKLDHPTTIHWHGMHIVNFMCMVRFIARVLDLTQFVIKPTEKFIIASPKMIQELFSISHTKKCKNKSHAVCMVHPFFKITTAMKISFFSDV